MLVPKGYYILTEEGAKKSIKAAIDAKAYLEKYTLADDALSKMAVKVSTLTMERDYANTLVSKKEKTVTGLTKKLRTANFIKWGAISAAAYMAIRLTISKSL